MTQGASNGQPNVPSPEIFWKRPRSKIQGWDRADEPYILLLSSSIRFLSTRCRRKA